MSEEKKENEEAKEVSAKDESAKDAAGKEGDLESEGGEAKPKSKKKLIIIAAIALILVIVPVALYFLGVFGSSKGGDDSAKNQKTEKEAKAEHENKGEAEEGKEKSESKSAESSSHGSKKEEGEANGEPIPEPVAPTGNEESVYYDMKEFIVNLNNDGKRNSFLKMTLSLELPGTSQIPPIEARMPKIRDSFQIFLREMRSDDLQGSAGMYRLREELLLRINKIVYPSKVDDILFKEILVQ